jgi:hypothetical protein
LLDVPQQPSVLRQTFVYTGWLDSGEDWRDRGSGRDGKRFAGQRQVALRRWTQGRRVRILLVSLSCQHRALTSFSKHSFEDRDVVAGRSTYNYARDSLRKTGISRASLTLLCICLSIAYTPSHFTAGFFTLIASSFLPSHRASFTLTLRSSFPLEVTPIPAEGAGMYARSIKGSWSQGVDGGKDEKTKNPRFRLRSEKATSVRCVLSLPFLPALRESRLTKRRNFAEFASSFPPSSTRSHSSSSPRPRRASQTSSSTRRFPSRIRCAEWCWKMRSWRRGSMVRRLSSFLFPFNFPIVCSLWTFRSSY